MKKVILVFILTFLFVINPNAEDLDCIIKMNINHKCVGIEGATLPYKDGDKLSCEITFKSDEDLTCEPSKEMLKSISFNLTNNGLDRLNETTGSGFIKTDLSGGYLLSREEGLNEGTLLKYEVVLPEMLSDTTFNINFYNIIVKNNNEIELGTNTTGSNIIIKGIKAKSNDNFLSNLNVSNYNLTPLFQSNISEYRLKVETKIGKINITPTPKDSKAVVSGDTGEKTLNYGENIFKINVKSEFGETRTYTLIVTRQDFRSDQNGLKSLTVSNTSFNFNPTILRYDLEVDRDVSSVIIKSSLIDPTASYIEGSGNITKSLVIGNNIVIIKVKAENEAIRTYTINIVRNDGKSSVNTLKSLIVNDIVEKIEFNPDVLNYTLKVSSNISSVELKSEMNSTKSTFVEGFGNRKVSLNPGLNSIQIKVKAENGNIKTYTLNITREDPKDNASLKSLNIDIEDFKFDPSIKEYNIEVSNIITKLNIKALPEEEKSKVTIEGNENLIVGKNIVKIIITSENGKTNEYVLNVTKRDKTSNVSKLKNINIEGYDIDFKSDVYEYKLKIKDESKLNITVEKEDPLSKYSILGNSKLKFGSKIKIISSAEDGTKSEYIIKITKDLSFILPMIGVSLIIFVIIVTASKGKKSVKVIKKKPIKTIKPNVEPIKDVPIINEDLVVETPKVEKKEEDEILEI